MAVKKKFMIILLMVISPVFCWEPMWISDKIKLADIRIFTVKEGKMTTSRRSYAVPQLKCVGGSAGCTSETRPKVMQCRNMGSDGIDIQWKCEARMKHPYILGRTDVLCEGYDYPEDPYVLMGSCGVEYTVQYEAGEMIRTFWEIIIVLAVIIVIILIIYGICKTCPWECPDCPTPPPSPPAPRPYQERTIHHHHHYYSDSSPDRIHFPSFPTGWSRPSSSSSSSSSSESSTRTVSGYGTTKRR